MFLKNVIVKWGVKFKEERPVKQYEQMTFIAKQGNEVTNDSIILCKDRYGNDVHVGDYVRLVGGPSLCKPLEGYVSQFILVEEAGVFLKLTTVTGRVIADLENPLFYRVEREGKG